MGKCLKCSEEIDDGSEICSGRNRRGILPNGASFLNGKGQRAKELAPLRQVRPLRRLE